MEDQPDEGGAHEIEPKEDSVTSTLEYRKWRTLSKATASIINLLDDFIQATSSHNDEEDEEYEEVDDETF